MHLVADLHVHTIASGHAYSTIKENLITAREKGLEMIAITDHGPGLPGGPGLPYFGYLQILPLKDEGVEILVGVEANIMDKWGNLDMPEKYLKRLDIVLAGFHPGCWEGGTVSENTRAMIGAMKNPYVDVIVHPGNPNYTIDIEEVIAAAKEYDIAMEINNSSLIGGIRVGSKENCSAIAAAAAREGITISVGSDAHYVDRVGLLEDALKLIENAGIKEQQVLNTSVDKIKSWLRGKGKLDKRY